MVVWMDFIPAKIAAWSVEKASAMDASLDGR